MTAVFIATPRSISNRDGSAHRAKLARLERALRDEYPRASIGLIRRAKVIEVQASERVFYGCGADNALAKAFREVAAACGY